MTIVKVTPENLRSGANAIDDQSAMVTGVDVGDPTPASTGLTGFGTAAALSGAQNEVTAALARVAARFTTMATLCRQTATAFEFASSYMPGTVTPDWMSTRIGDGLTAMGEFTSTTTPATVHTKILV